MCSKDLGHRQRSVQFLVGRYYHYKEDDFANVQLLLLVTTPVAMALLVHKDLQVMGWGAKAELVMVVLRVVSLTYLRRPAQINYPKGYDMLEEWKVSHNRTNTNC